LIEGVEAVVVFMCEESLAFYQICISLSCFLIL